MNTTFDYTKVPCDFVHCLNGQCPRAKECLRHLTAQHIPNDRTTINIVTPAHASAQGKECSFFLSTKTQKYAQGLKHIYNQLPYGKAIVIKQQIIGHFGKTMYYRLWREERLITPAQQKYIVRVFQSKGIEEAPMFDKFIEQYAFSQNDI